MKQITVTDHAVVRWLERVAGLDVEDIRDQIRAKTRTAIEHGASAVKADDNHVYVLDGAVVVTVNPKLGYTVPKHLRPYGDD